MNNWYLTAVKFTKEFTDGTLKRTTDAHLISSLSFTEAEARAHYEVGQYVRGEFIVKSIAKVDFEDVFRYEDADKWFKAVIEMVMEDADTGKEKQLKNNYLIEAATVAEAGERLEESLKGLLATYSVKKIEETAIVEVHAYDPEFGKRINVNYEFGSDVVFKVENVAEESPMKENLDFDPKHSMVGPEQFKDLLFEAVGVVFDHNGGSAGLLVKAMEIDYKVASKLISALSDNQIIGPFNGTKPRELMLNDKDEALQKITVDETV